MWKYLLLTFSIGFLAGFLTGKGKKQVQIVHEKGKIQEKVVYRDTVHTRVVRSTKTTTNESGTVLESKEEVFVANTKEQNRDSYLSLESETKIDVNNSSKWGLGVFYDIQEPQSKKNAFHPFLIFPAYGVTSIFVTTDLNFNSVSVGVSYLF